MHYFPLRYCQFAWVLLGLATAFVYGADDVLTLNHGLQHKGQVVELGGNSVELVVPGGGNRKILKRDIREVAFDKTRRQATVHDTDAVVIKGGHRIPGKVEIVDNGR